MAHKEYGHEQGDPGIRRSHGRSDAVFQLRVFVQMQDELLARERLEARTTTLVEQGI